MTVFRGFLMITRQNLLTVFLYIAIFLAIAIVIPKSGGDTSAGFEAVSLDIAVIDRDGGTLARGLADYLGQYHTLTDIPDDSSVIQDRMFYRDVYYVVTIPESFEERCLYGDERLPVTKVPGSNSGYYVDRQIDTFLNGIRIMVEGGFPVSDAIANVSEIGKDTADVRLLDTNGYGGKIPDHAFLFQYMPYILISILCYTLSYITIAFRKPDVKMRTLCSAVPVRSQNLQLAAGYAVVGAGIWGICMAMPAVLYGKVFLSDPNLPYYLANSFLMTLVSLSLAFLVGTLIKSAELVNAVVNVLSLGMSFLCGVFVSLDVLDKNLQKVAQFLPAYWYETVNSLLAHNRVPDHSQQIAIYTGYGLQLLFAAAILGVALVISKNRQAI